jgi:hypothetical protein
VPRPPATATHIPVPHLAVVEGLVDTLSRRHIAAVGEEFAVSKDGMEMFGVIDLETSFDGCASQSGSGMPIISDSAVLYCRAARVRV